MQALEEPFLAIALNPRLIRKLQVETILQFEADYNEKRGIPVDPKMLPKEKRPKVGVQVDISNTRYCRSRTGVNPRTDTADIVQASPPQHSERKYSRKISTPLCGPPQTS